MANADPKHLGIDIQHILNNKIRESDFEWVLKMNVGARGKYLKIYNNREWFFEFLNNRIIINYWKLKCDVQDFNDFYLHSNRWIFSTKRFNYNTFDIFFFCFFEAEFMINLRKTG